MHISTLNGHVDLGDTRARRSGSERERSERSEVQAVESAIADLQVSSQNVAASESQGGDAEISTEMLDFTRSQIDLAGTAINDADAVPQTILDLLQ
jgi:flagellin-like hook-associated protein FlgL